jgi:hypothetical protein
LVIVTWLLIGALFRGWDTLSELSRLEQSSVAFLAALVLVGIGYYAGNFWDDHVFDPLYGFDPKSGVTGRWNDTTRRNFLGLLPAGDDLRRARQRAIAALLPSGSDGAGIYRTAERVLGESRQSLGGRLPLSKIFRTLIWPSILLFVVLLILAMMGNGGATPLVRRWLVGAFGALLLAGALFIPYLNLRVEHMIQLYERAAGMSGWGGESDVKRVGIL